MTTGSRGSAINRRDFSTARADAFTGSEREEKASTRSGRNDRSCTRAIVRTWGAACCAPTQKMMAKGQRDLQLGGSAERALAKDLALGESGLNWRARARQGGALSNWPVSQEMWARFMPMALRPGARAKAGPQR